MALMFIFYCDVLDHHIFAHIVTVLAHEEVELHATIAEHGEPLQDKTGQDVGVLPLTVLGQGSNHLQANIYDKV